jgi:DNA-binding transcriptional regulator YbjK
VTVEAISEATIQVLLAVGLHRLTKSRVAERARVSVGTLYQYYPNKQGLLYAGLKVHSIKGSGSSGRRVSPKIAALVWRY